jgi:hypothetical protein
MCVCVCVCVCVLYIGAPWKQARDRYDEMRTVPTLKDLAPKHLAPKHKDLAPTLQAPAPAGPAGQEGQEFTKKKKV